MWKQKLFNLIPVFILIGFAVYVLGSFIYYDTHPNTSNLSDNSFPVIPNYPNADHVQSIKKEAYEIENSYTSADNEETVFNWYIRELTATGWTFYGQNDIDKLYHRVSFYADKECYSFSIFIIKKPDGFTLDADRSIKRNCTYGIEP